MENQDETETVVFDIEGHQIECPKKLLIDNSDYFSVMFGGDFRESSQRIVKIEGVDFKSFNTILLILWDHTYLIDLKEIHMVLQAACMLQFTNIKKMCENRILENLNPPICIKIWRTTELLDISPLWLEAKSMALEEFDQICDSSSVLELSLDEICTYLGHVNLKVQNELTVFQTALSWWYENQEVYGNEDSTRVILRLLNCIDFKKLKNNEIPEMQTYPDIADNSEIVSVLNCIRQLLGYQIEVQCEFSVDQVKYATHLFNSKSRRVPGVPCILLQEAEYPLKKKAQCTERVERNVVVYDVTVNRFRDFFVIDADKVRGLVGCKFLAYKEFVFLYGGEFTLGNGHWNMNVWLYDTIKERWERKSVLPYERRHFETALVGNRIYIVGGTGRFRVVQENLLWYDIASDRWSCLIALPSNTSKQAKCCSFDGKLWMVCLADRRAFIFNPQFDSWISFQILIEREIVNAIGSFTVFSDNQFIYAKGKQFIKFSVDRERGTLVPVSQRIMRNIDYEEVECVLCNNIVYTLYKCVNIHYAAFFTFEVLNLETGDLHYIFRNKYQGIDTIDVEGKIFYPAQYTKLFFIHYYFLVKENIFVNDSLPE